MSLKRAPASNEALIFLIITLFAVSLTSGFYITFGGFNRSITSLIGLSIFLIFFVSSTKKLRPLPLLIALAFFIPTAMDIFVHQSFDTTTFVFIFNLLTFYFLAGLISKLSNAQVSFVMASFVSSFVVFAAWHYTTNDFSHSRFFYNSFNPNEVAIIGLSSLAFIYILSHESTVKKFYATFETILRVMLLLSVVTIIFLIAATGTRFAVMGSALLSLGPMIRPMISARTSHNSKYQTTLYASGLIFSVFAMVGSGGLSNVSERMVWSSDNKNIFYKVGEPSKSLVYDLGKVDGSISSLGGRLPSHKLAYYMSLHHPLSGIGFDHFNAERERLNVPSPHNVLVESYIHGGVLGGMVIAGLLIFSIVFGVHQYLLSNGTSYLILGSILVISMTMNLWYLKIFWFLLSILVGQWISKKAET